MNSNLEIRLEGPPSIGTAAQCAGRRYSDDNDDVRTMLADVCAALEETVSVRFIVRAFDEMEWPVSLSTDLCVLLEQLPQVAHATENKQAFDLDFFEQGLERTLHFQPDGLDFIVSCTSYHSRWVPAMEAERISMAEIRGVLGRLIHEFGRLA
ncbi:MAG TPA: hypothetical protein VKP30_03420, partial [Polyangiaceae bacterium]|nr:hypothetical protein [Polyangiaceae bacterium]